MRTKIEIWQDQVSETLLGLMEDMYADGLTEQEIRELLVNRVEQETQVGQMWHPDKAE